VDGAVDGVVAGGFDGFFDGFLLVLYVEPFGLGFFGE